MTKMQVETIDLAFFLDERKVYAKIDFGLGQRGSAWYSGSRSY
jgi:hypothetical protein